MDAHGIFHAIAMRVLVAGAVEGEILSVDGVSVLALFLEHMVENQGAEKFRLRPGIKLGAFNFATEVALFIGEKGKVIPVAANECLAFQSQQAGLDPVAQGEAVGIDLVETEGDQIIHAALHLIDIANEEQDLENGDIE